jgi:predicted nucleotidyltransferase
MDVGGDVGGAAAAGAEFEGLLEHHGGVSLRRHGVALRIAAGWHNPATMASVLDSHLAEIPALCRRYGVARLELFGSAASGEFDPQRSDLDFLVQFDTDSSRLFDRYFGLKESLEALYGRRVDLVTAGSLRNPYFIEAVNRSRQLVYAAEDAQAA